MGHLPDARKVTTYHQGHHSHLLCGVTFQTIKMD